MNTLAMPVYQFLKSVPSLKLNEKETTQDIDSLESTYAQSVLNATLDALESFVPINIQNVADYAEIHGLLHLDPENVRLPFPFVITEYKSPVGTEVAVVFMEGQTDLNKGHINVMVLTKGYPESVHYKGLFQWEMATGEIFLPERIRIGNEVARSIGWAFAVSLLSFKFIQCKNVRLVDEQPQRSRQARRQRERQGLPEITYKTIRIDPNRTTTIGESHEQEESGNLLPLHIVRGNFATYTKDRPLFGKYVGTFWRPAHTRGNAERGIVKTSYVVDSPKEEAV